MPRQAHSRVYNRQLSQSVRSAGHDRRRRQLQCQSKLFPLAGIEFACIPPAQCTVLARPGHVAQRPSPSHNSECMCVYSHDPQRIPLRLLCYTHARIARPRHSHVVNVRQANALRRARLNVSHDTNTTQARLSSRRLRTEHSRASSSQSSSLFLHQQYQSKAKVRTLHTSQVRHLVARPSLARLTSQLLFLRWRGNPGESLLAWQDITGSSVARCFGLPTTDLCLPDLQVRPKHSFLSMMLRGRRRAIASCDDIFLRYHLHCIESLQRLQGRLGSAMSLY